MTSFYGNIHSRPLLTKQDLHAMKHLKRIERRYTMPEQPKPTVECPACGAHISELWWAMTGTVQLKRRYHRDEHGNDAYTGKPYWEDFGLAADCFYRCPQCEGEIDVEWLEQQGVI